MTNAYFRYFLDNHINKYSFFFLFLNIEMFFEYDTPFLDNELIDFMGSTSLLERYNQNIYRKMLIKNYKPQFVTTNKIILLFELKCKIFQFNSKKKSRKD